MTSFLPCKQGFPSARQGGSDWVCANLILVDCRGDCSLLPAQVPATTPPEVALSLPSHVPFRFSFPFRSHSHPHPSSDLHRRLPSSPLLTSQQTVHTTCLLTHSPRVHRLFVSFAQRSLLKKKADRFKRNPFETSNPGGICPESTEDHATVPKARSCVRVQVHGTAFPPLLQPPHCPVSVKVPIHSTLFVSLAQVYHPLQPNSIQSHLLTPRTTEGNPSTSFSTRHSHPLTIHLNRRHAIVKISHNFDKSAGPPPHEPRDGSPLAIRRRRRQFVASIVPKKPFTILHSRIKPQQRAYAYLFWSASSPVTVVATQQ